MKDKVGTSNEAAHSSDCDLWLSSKVLNWLLWVVRCYLTALGSL